MTRAAGLQLALPYRTGPYRVRVQRDPQRTGTWLIYLTVDGRPVAGHNALAHAAPTFAAAVETSDRIRAHLQHMAEAHGGTR